MIKVTRAPAAKRSGGKAKAGDARAEKAPTGAGGGQEGFPAVKVSFVLPVSETPDPVSVCGDFNDWDPLAHPLKKRANGTRSASLELASGRYAFKYLSGGTWFTDAEAHSHEVNEYGETNSILMVE